MAYSPSSALCRPFSQGQWLRNARGDCVNRSGGDCVVVGSCRRVIGHVLMALFAGYEQVAARLRRRLPRGSVHIPLSHLASSSRTMSRCAMTMKREHSSPGLLTWGDHLCSAAVFIDLVAQDELGAGLAGRGGVELLAERGECMGAPGCGQRVELDMQDAGAWDDVAAGGQCFADASAGLASSPGAWPCRRVRMTSSQTCSGVWKCSFDGSVRRRYGDSGRRGT